MHRTLVVLFLVGILAMPSLALAKPVEPLDFEVDTAQNIFNLCTASTTDPLYREAITFCHAYLAGAYDYYKATTGEAGGKRLFCPPSPAPTRNEGVNMFMEWLKAHPQYMSEEAVDAEFRFLMDKWPCKP